MRLLMQDVVKNAATVISSVNEQGAYPAQNLNSVFLKEQFISIFADDVVTIDLGEDMDLNCVFIAYLNAALFDIEIKNNALSTVYSDTDVSNSLAVLPIYLSSTVQGRYIIITADASLGLADFVDTDRDDGSYLKIQGIGAGVYFETDDGGPLNGFGLGASTGTTSFESPSGQVISTQMPWLEERKWPFAAQTLEAAMEFKRQVRLLGLHNPTYMDFLPDAPDQDPPIYARITNFEGPTRSGVEYTFSFEIKEAR